MLGGGWGGPGMSLAFPSCTQGSVLFDKLVVFQGFLIISG